MTTSPSKDIGFGHFVLLMAAMMSTNAFALDIMLPALRQIGEAIGVTRPNGQQLILTAYIVGSGIAMLVFGPLSDRYGRKPTIIVGMAIYAVCAAVAGFTSHFETMIAARFVQGIGAAAPRVLVVSVVRDRYAGRQMARVMSLTMLIILAVPILAPSFGQALMFFMPWRGLFAALAGFGTAILLWVYLALPETLHPEDRRPVSLTSIKNAVRLVTSNRTTLGYIFGQMLTMGTTMGLIISAQQIFVEVFHMGVLFPPVFAGVAGGMAIGSFLNARIVAQVGMRRVSHTAMVVFFFSAVAHTIVAYTIGETIVSFFIFQSIAMCCAGLMSSNFNAIAMEPMGHVAGTASSIQGFLTTIGSGLLGYAIGQNFAGSANALIVGSLMYVSAVIIVVVLTEGGRLFRTGAVPSTAASR